MRNTMSEEVKVEMTCRGMMKQVGVAMDEGKAIYVQIKSFKKIFKK